MKKIVFALSFALFAPACMTPLPSEGTTDSPQTSVEASPLAAPRTVDPVCLQACGEAYQSCLDGAVDDSAACNCDNSRILCERRCGRFGALHPCL